MGIKFFDDMKALGLGYAIDCAKADIQFNTDMFLYNCEFEKRQKKRETGEYSFECPHSLLKDTPNLHRSVINSNIVSFNPIKEDEENTAAEPVQQSDENKLLPVATADTGEASIITIGLFSDDDIANNLDDAYTELSGYNKMHVRLTVLALLYVGCYISIESVYKNIVADNSEEELEYLNSLIYAISSIPLTNEKPRDIRDLIAIEELKQIVKYEASYSQVKGSVEIDAAVVAMDNLNMVKNEDGENIIVSPLSFATKPDPTPAAVPTITSNEINLLERKFDGILGEYNHQFNKIMDLYELVVAYPDHYESFLIDPGHVFGIGMALLIERYGSMMPLSVNLKETCKKVISNRLAANTLTQKEMLAMTKNLMADYRIYTNIDMSRGEEIIGKMNSEEYKKFQNLLSIMFTLPWGCDGRPALPRTRFRSFRAWNDFILVSDDKVKCPSLGNFNMLISEMTIIVKNDKILIRYGDNEGVVDLNEVA